MKKQLLLLFFVFDFASCYAQGNWSYNALNEGKSAMEVGSIGSKIFFYSGNKRLGGVAVFTTELEIFDVHTGNKEVITLTGDQIRRDMAIVTSGSKIFFAGGDYYALAIPTVYFKRVDVYDTLTQQWTVEELSQGRAFLAGAAANDKVLFGGGFGTDEVNHVSRILNIYNQDTQTRKDTVLPANPVGNGGSARQDLTAASVGNKILFAGGYITGNYRDMVNIYDTKQQKWLPNAALSQKKTQLKSIVYHNKVFFVGGNLKNNIPSDTIDIYDNATNTWSVMKIPHIFKRTFGEVVQAGCKIFLIPLGDGTSADSLAVYDLARNTWSYNMMLPHPRMGVTAAAAKNKVYFAGGSEFATAQHTNIIDILTLEPKLQLAIENTAVTSYNFGTVLQGEEKNVDVAFSNEGDYELLFDEQATRISITGDVNDFTIDPGVLQLKDTLSPAEIISLPLTFHPTSTGLKTLTISVYSNDPDHPVYSFTVQGIGTDVTTVEDAQFSNSLQVYPNPTTGLLHVNSKTQEPLYVEVLNTQGILMKQGQYINNNEAVDLSSLTDGLYFLKIANATSSTVVKVLKK